MPDTMDAIYFDLDGTLTDPRSGSRVRSSMRSTNSVTRYSRRGRVDLVHRAAASRQFHQAARRRACLRSRSIAVPGALCRYRDFRNSLYAGIADILTELSRPGRRLFVATSKPGVFAERIIDHFGCAVTSNACSAPNSTAPAPTRPTFCNMRSRDVRGPVARHHDRGPQP